MFDEEYYRKRPDKFLEDFFDIKLLSWQIIFLRGTIYMQCYLCDGTKFCEEDEVENNA